MNEADRNTIFQAMAGVLTRPAHSIRVVDNKRPSAGWRPSWRDLPPSANMTARSECVLCTTEGSRIPFVWYYDRGPRQWFERTAHNEIAKRVPVDVAEWRPMPSLPRRKRVK